MYTNVIFTETEEIKLVVEDKHAIQQFKLALFNAIGTYLELICILNSKTICQSSHSMLKFQYINTNSTLTYYIAGNSMSMTYFKHLFRLFLQDFKYCLHCRGDILLCHCLHCHGDIMLCQCLLLNCMLSLIHQMGWRASVYSAANVSFE